MILSKAVYKRARPHLGTVVRLTLRSNLSPMFIESALAEAFSEISRLEKIFNFHDPDSELNRFNYTQNTNVPELREVLQTAQDLAQKSGGAFSPSVNGLVDLGGLAKGFIVDRIALLLQHKNLSGVVNAGGDLKMFGDEYEPILLRLGTAQKPLLKMFRAPKAAVATSSPIAPELNSDSTTRYRGCWSAFLPRQFTVVTTADSCEVADGLTKVVLFGDKECVERCCHEQAAQALVFDEQAQLVAAFGVV